MMSTQMREDSGSLAEQSGRSLSRGGNGERILSVAEFLYQEAELLDERRFDEWLRLFADQLLYWVPANDDEDPRRAVSIIFDDRMRLTERVQRLQRGTAPSLQPPSHTLHVIGNVRIRDGAAERLLVTSRYLVTEVRLDDEYLYTANVEHHLMEDSGGFLIAKKIVRLSRRNLALGPISFLF